MSTVLIADDAPDVRDTLARFLRQEGYIVHEALVCQMDAPAPHGDAVVFTGSGSIARGVRTQVPSAHEYVELPPELERLLPAVRSAAAHRHRVGAGAPHDRRGPPPIADPLIAVAPRMRRLVESLGAIGAADGTVLIMGETGVGKDVVAHRLAQSSRRRGARFVPINCGGLPDTLVDSELFGYRKGAFTGAAADTKGLIEEAEGGVLFLDEIGDMPLAAQSRLLRFLDSGEVRRIGDTVVRRADVRVIAATNRPLEEDVGSGRFRQDLYYRLSVVVLNVPPLRERREDIVPLGRHFLTRAAERLRKTIAGFSDEALLALECYQWPGNIRELHNAVEHAAIVAASETIAAYDLPPAVRASGLLYACPPDVPLDEEWRRMAVTLQQCDGNQRRAARALGISRTTLWRRLRRAPLSS